MVAEVIKSNPFGLDSIPAYLLYLNTEINQLYSNHAFHPEEDHEIYQHEFSNFSQLDGNTTATQQEITWECKNAVSLPGFSITKPNLPNTTTTGNISLNMKNATFATLGMNGRM